MLSLTGHPTCRAIVNEIRVKVRRLDTLIREAVPTIGEIDVVCIDVEGWEIEVLQGLSSDRHMAKVFIIENLFAEQTYVDYMAGEGYSLWQRVEPNDIFVRKDLLTAETETPDR